MFMRLVNARYKPEALAAIREVYNSTIIPRLEKIDGCLCVCAITNDKNPEEGISLTLWETPEHARAYEKSGLFEELRGKTQHTYSDFYRWKMALEKKYGSKVKTSEDLKLDTYSVVIGKSFR